MFRYTGVTSVALRDREKAKTGKLLLVMISRDTKRSSHSLFIPFLFIYLFIYLLFIDINALLNKNKYYEILALPSFKTYKVTLHTFGSSVINTSCHGRYAPGPRGGA